MSVETRHPSYTAMEHEWETIPALCKGTREVKKTKILPNPDPEDFERNKDYLERAIYTNIVGRTKVGLSGAAFREKPVLDNLPAELQYLEESTDGNNLSLDQFAKNLLGDLLCTAREIILVDYPPVDEGLTVEETKGLQAVLLRYSALDLINWGPNFFVLREFYNSSENEFEHEMSEQFRVLRLRDNVYTQQVYRDGDPLEEIVIRKADGSAFDYIPLIVVGAQNNDVTVDEIPLADIAYVNAGHYRNSADLEENCHVHSQLTIGISTDLDAKSWKEMNPNGVRVGSRTGVYLGPDGRFDSVQAEPNNLADVLMKRKEEQMIMLGARLIEKRDPAESATAAKIDATGENSVLADLVDNVEEGINTSLLYAGDFMGATIKGDEYKMNRQFFADDMDPQSAIAAIQFYDRSLLTKEDIAKVARKSGFVSEDTTDEDLINNMIDPGVEDDGDVQPTI